VFDRCRVEEPPLFEVGNGQQAACWLAEGGRSLPTLPARAPEPIRAADAMAVTSADVPADTTAATAATMVAEPNA
jgi:hypothetical protein